MKRRNFIRLAYGSAVGASIPGISGLLAGCGSGSGSPPPANMTGMVNTNDVGGAGLLVQSVYAASAPVAADGSFTSSFSSIGTQLIAVMDGAGALRGMSLYNPAPLPSLRSRQAAPSLVLDSRSTAIALVFITPGILTTDTREASQRQAQIGSLGTFPALLAFVAQNLKSSSLSALAADASLNSLKAACIREWAAGHGYPDAPPAVSLPGAAGFTVKLSSSQGDPPTVHLTNRAWRWINVARQDQDQNRAPQALKDPVFLAMSGAAGNTWGSIFSSSIDHAATATEKPDLGDPGRSAYLDYAVRGPGANGGPTLSFTPTSSEGTAWGASALFYTVAPFIDLVFGEVRLLSQTRTLADGHSLSQALLVEINGVAAQVQSMITALVAGDRMAGAAAVERTAAAYLNAAESLLAALGVTAVGGNIILPPAPGPILRTLASAWSPANFTLAARTWLQYPRVSVTELRNSGADINITYDVPGVSSIKVEIKSGSDTVASQLLTTSSTSSTTNASFDGLPAGDLTVTLSAYDNSSGSGTALVTSSSSFHTNPGDRASVDIRLDLAVDSVDVTPSSLQLTVGGTQQLTATAKSGGTEVTIPSGSWDWQSSNSSIAVVDSSGNVRGVSEGTAQIEVTELHSGKSASVTVTVSADSRRRMAFPSRHLTRG